MKPKERKIAVVGLGYVGLPVAVAFGRAHEVLGFDINEQRISELRTGTDRTGEVSPQEIQVSRVRYTTEASDLKWADFHIVAIPTPVDKAHRPDLGPLMSATRSVGKAIKKGDIVVFESTVYPGVTEEICGPILEEESGLKSGVDFKLGYSPERINPGDKEHSFTRIKKVVSGQDPETLEIIAQIYGSVVQAGVFRAKSIRVAEAAKAIENTQRDLNIAFMNELALLFDRMNLDTQAVLEAAGTKWNFLNFKPGLVGGHCIGVDPYYLTHKAEELGYTPQVILAGRKINDGMGKFIAQKTIKLLSSEGIPVGGSRATVLGFTFKENCPDSRNTRVIDIVQELKEYGIETQVHDPLADPKEVKDEYGLDLVTLDDLEPSDSVIIAVAHDEFKKLEESTITSLLKTPKKGVIIDVKGIINKADKTVGIKLWRL